MDLVTLVALCSVAFDPGLMHALVIAQSEGRPWSFRAGDGALRGFGTAGQAVIEARAAQGDGTSIRVGLTGLPTDLFSMTAQPNEALFEPCPNIVLASLRLSRRVETCRVRYPSEHAERCALATFHGSFEAPDWVFADAIATRSAAGDLPNPGIPGPCPSTASGPKSSVPEASPAPKSRAIFVPLTRDRR